MLLFLIAGKINHKFTQPFDSWVWQYAKTDFLAVWHSLSWHLIWQLSLNKKNRQDFVASDRFDCRKWQNLSTHVKLVIWCFLWPMDWCLKYLYWCLSVSQILKNWISLSPKWRRISSHEWLEMALSEKENSRIYLTKQWAFIAFLDFTVVKKTIRKLRKFYFL